jgi:hypothetical protein
MEAIYFSETSVDFQRTARHHIPEDSTFHNQRFENLKSLRRFVSQMFSNKRPLTQTSLSWYSDLINELFVN